MFMLLYRVKCHSKSTTDSNHSSCILHSLYLKKKQVVTKKRAVLATRFKCPFCANDKVVECKMDRQKAIGSLNCRICGASYQMAM